MTSVIKRFIDEANHCLTKMHVSISSKTLGSPLEKLLLRGNKSEIDITHKVFDNDLNSSQYIIIARVTM